MDHLAQIPGLGIAIVGFALWVLGSFGMGLSRPVLIAGSPLWTSNVRAVSFIVSALLMIIGFLGMPLGLLIFGLSLIRLPA